ncbi:MAG TPA: hypothetical protein PLZ78_07925 [Spirochaetota bacterium]|nr:hypothetical protein [Spirochaetota bacterium]
MVAVVKLLLIFASALSLAVAPAKPLTFVSALLMFSLMALYTQTGPKRLLARNALVALFAFFFMGMAAVSAFVRGETPSVAVPLLGARMLLIFNAIYLGGRWIGRFGALRLIDLVPSERVRLFLFLLVKQTHSLLATNRTVIDALRSRIDMDRRGRRVVARHYIQNMLYRELRSIRNLQAAMYVRLADGLGLYHRPDVFGLTDALIAVAALSCVFAAMPDRWFQAWMV